MSQLISFSDAITMTTAFRADRETLLATGYKNNNTLPKSETFDRLEIETLLGLTDCEAIRIYYGLDSNSRVHAILVGVDSNDEDIIPQSSNYDATIVEQGRRCPDDCPPSSLLNS